MRITSLLKNLFSCWQWLDTWACLLYLACFAGTIIGFHALLADHRPRFYYVEQGTSGGASVSCVSAWQEWSSNSTAFCSNDIHQAQEVAQQMNGLLAQFYLYQSDDSVDIPSFEKHFKSTTQQGVYNDLKAPYVHGEDSKLDEDGKLPLSILPPLPSKPKEKTISGFKNLGIDTKGIVVHDWGISNRLSVSDQYGNPIPQ